MDPMDLQHTPEAEPEQGGQGAQLLRAEEKGEMRMRSCRGMKAGLGWLNVVSQSLRKISAPHPLWESQGELGSCGWCFEPSSTSPQGVPGEITAGKREEKRGHVQPPACNTSSADN